MIINTKAILISLLQVFHLKPLQYPLNFFGNQGFVTTEIDLNDKMYENANKP